MTRRFLDDVGHPYFGPLREDQRKQIANYVSSPSLFKWTGGYYETEGRGLYRGSDGKNYAWQGGVASIIIGSKNNHPYGIYSAVTDLDPSYHYVDGQAVNFPDGMLVMRAIRNARNAMRGK